MNSSLCLALATVFVAACAAQAPVTGPSDSSQDTTETKKGGKNESSGGDSSGGGGATGGGATGGGGTGGGAGTAGGSAPSGATVGNCDDPAPASLPQMTSKVVFADSSHPVPTASGGDEKGTWVVTNVTAFLPSSGSFLVDADSSRAEGTAFLKLDGKRFLISSDITTTIATRIVGDQTSASQTKIAGTYTVKNGTLTVNAECTETNADSSQQQQPTSMGFSRTSDTEAMFLQTGPSQAGDVTLAMNLKKVK